MSMRCWLRGKFVYFLYCFFYKITVNSLLRISVISFSLHKNYVTVKFALGCIQLNDKLVARLKIGLTAKQFWNETRGILPTRGPCCCCCQVLHKFFHWKRIEWPSNLRGMNSMKFKISWPNTGCIKVWTNGLMPPLWFCRSKNIAEAFPN